MNKEKQMNLHTLEARTQEVEGAVHALQSHAANKNDIVEMLDTHKKEIKSFGVKSLGLFGSFVRSQQHRESDVDLLVEFESDQKTFDHFMALSFFLEDLLKRRVELVTPEALSPYIGPHILEEVEYVYRSS
jgi:predicted nucleotidyltransferase